MKPRGGKMLQEDDGGKMTRIWKDEFGFYLDGLPARMYFQSHGWPFN